MKNFSLTEFEYALKDYLSTLCLNELRVLGRYYGVAEPTKKKKNLLITELISVLIGQSMPIERNHRGAPVKNDYVDPTIIDKIEQIRFAYTTPNAKDTASGKNMPPFRIQAPKTPLLIFSDGTEDKECVGQLEIVDNVPCLLPLNAEISSGKIHIGVEIIRYYNLKEGDVIKCRAQKQGNLYSVIKIETVNGVDCALLIRNAFDSVNACYPQRRISFINGNSTSVEAKYLQWILPIGYGQRGLLIAPPKTGKTRFLLETAKSIVNSNAVLLVLLLEQPPEIINLFKKSLPKDSIVATSYDDEAETHVFAADFLLRRAKRYAEMGNDVILLIDSISSLAKAYNETDASSGGKMLQCGLESKTIAYIKKYFSAAMCSIKGGSITILSAVSCETGNPADDYLTAELSTLANAHIRLNSLLASARIFPAVDLAKSNVQAYDLLLNEKELAQENFIRQEYAVKYGIKKLNTVLEESKTFEEFCKNTK